MRGPLRSCRRGCEHAGIGAAYWPESGARCGSRCNLILAGLLAPIETSIRRAKQFDRGRFRQLAVSFQRGHADADGDVDGLPMNSDQRVAHDTAKFTSDAIRPI